MNEPLSGTVIGAFGKFAWRQAAAFLEELSVGKRRCWNLHPFKFSIDWLTTN
jgi:hypothetical protein